MLPFKVTKKDDDPCADTLACVEPLLSKCCVYAGPTFTGPEVEDVILLLSFDASFPEESQAVQLSQSFIDVCPAGSGNYTASLQSVVLLPLSDGIPVGQASLQFMRLNYDNLRKAFPCLPEGNVLLANVEVDGVAPYVPMQDDITESWVVTSQQLPVPPFGNLIDFDIVINNHSQSTAKPRDFLIASLSGKFAIQASP